MGRFYQLLCRQDLLPTSICPSLQPVTVNEHLLRDRLRNQEPGVELCTLTVSRSRKKKCLENTKEVASYSLVLYFGFHTGHESTTRVSFLPEKGYCEIAFLSGQGYLTPLCWLLHPEAGRGFDAGKALRQA